MRRVVVALAMACVAGSAGSAQADVFQTLSLDGESSIRLIDRSEDALVFEVNVGEIEAHAVSTPAGVFTRLTIPRFHKSLEAGEPELPMMNRLFEIPLGASARIEEVSFETRTVALSELGMAAPVFPAQESLSKSADPSSVPFRWNEDAYRPGRKVEPVLVSVADVGRLRSVRIGRLEVAPVVYDPGEGLLTIRHKIRFTVRLSGADRDGDRALKLRTESPFFEGIYRRLSGYRSVHEDHPDLVRGRVVYVVVADRMFEPLLAPFVSWKTEQGFAVVEAYTDLPEVGTSLTSIRNYLHGLYNGGDAADPAPTFVLFVGDTNIIPCWQLDGATDLPYCDVTGDNIPDMYYGRFSARTTAELAPQIDKTLEYERFTMPDPSYLSEVVLIAGVDDWYAEDYGNGQINYGTRHYFNAGHGIEGDIYLYPESGWSDVQIRQDVSDGVGFVNYSAHGWSGGWADPAFENGHIDQLQNDHEYCLAVGNCCSTSEFNVGDCFAEHWLRAADKGAIGYIGGSNSTYWDEDYWWAVGAGPVVSSGADYEETGLGSYDGVWHDHGEAIDQWYVVQDALIFCGNLAVVEGGGMSTYYWRIYNLMGDPSLSPYLGAPSANDVVHDQVIAAEAPGIHQFCVVSAAPNSYIGFSKNGELVGCGLVGPAGQAAVGLKGHGTTGMVRLVVTCQNKIPYTADIPVGDAASAGGLTAGDAQLVQSWPNPFRDAARIRLTLDRPEMVGLQIFDPSGRLVRTLADGPLPAGIHGYGWDGRDGAGREVASGLYLARLRAGSASTAWKMVLDP